MIPGSINALLLGEEAGGAAAYSISRSLRFNSSDSAYLSRSVSSAGNRKLWTLSMWVKRGTLTDGALFHAPTTTSGTAHTWCNFSGDILNFYDFTGSTYNFLRQTAQVFRDPSAWYHLVFSIDSDNATAANRARIYVNGTEVTTWASTSTAAAGFSTAWNNNVTHQISSQSQYFNGYLADVHFIDGQALTPSSFTEVSATTGQLIPKAYTGTFTGNSFWLKFADNSAATATTLGKDSSGLGNNWTPNNLSVTAGAGNDSLVDTPTSYGTDTGAGGEVRGNYCTLNPIDRLTTATLSNGNLEFTTATTGHNAIGTIGMVSGKWYWEASTTAGTTQARATVYGASASSYYSFAANNTVYGFRFDADSGVLEYTTNGSSWTSLATGLTSGPYFPYFNNNGTTSKTIIANFGQRPFAYTAPSGFKALCDTNLPAPVVAKPSTVMDVALYTGNGSTQTISGLGFSPDFVWIKGRGVAVDHQLYDQIRGVTRPLISNATYAEGGPGSYGLTAFNSDGFSLNDIASGGYGVNGSPGGTYSGASAAYVAWAWDAGSSTVSNTQGSITSQVRANASAGFSIVTYTGTGANATVGHGLGVQPRLVVVKRRDSTGNWFTWHTSISATTYLALNTTAATTTLSTVWNDTAPTSTVFSIGTSAGINTSSATYVAYCFAPVAGYSNGFSYTGNGSTDGSFVYLGFRPRLILLKCSSTTGNWTLLDTAREGYNVDNDPLYPNLSDAEGTTDLLDITSNGFKLRTTNASVNSSGATYVGYAWAEAPFAYSRAR